MIWDIRSLTLQRKTMWACGQQCRHIMLGSKKPQDNGRLCAVYTVFNVLQSPWFCTTVGVRPCRIKMMQLSFRHGGRWRDRAELRWCNPLFCTTAGIKAVQDWGYKTSYLARCLRHHQGSGLALITCCGCNWSNSAQVIKGFVFS